MILTMFNGYPDFIGYRQSFCGSGAGPASYSQTTGDPLTLSNNRRFIDDVASGWKLSLSGNYYVRPWVQVAGERQAWTLLWYVTATNVQVANGINLAAETVVLSGFCGQF
jgi:hypothetical protein